MNDEFYMNILINHTWKTQGCALPNPSVGAMILDSNNQIIALEVHDSFGDSHAELKAYKSAYIKLNKDKRLDSINNPNEIYEFLSKNHNGIFFNTTIFVTLEPCAHFGKTPPCAKLISELKPRRVVISSKEKNSIASHGSDFIKSHNIEVRMGVLENKGDDLLLPFLELKKNNSLSIYKIAQRLNGSFKNGTISSIESRIYSHKLRNVADKILISQKTVLNDNPMLDSRLVNGRAPEICVIGRENKLNKDLNIFLANREIYFVNKINDLDFKGFNIIEGGGKLFKTMEKHIKYMLVFISPKMMRGVNFQSNFSGRILNSFTLGEDVVLWIQKN